MVIVFENNAYCYACGDANLNGFEIHEVAEGVWNIFCIDCSFALELDEGK